ncbi:hypothetical protein NG895_15485 [Aeoliella sp. ICT_H6.2]|uniref:Uncharacterized protein n=1 Tax=Aeoliella straminimaris TaxID=2954799 RepID=A0A9X2JI55_9BACT|nr:hypothetical protein [Aeoliella straminimaris]MCO6045313.1 hypothetical protein [Aeoliella straminimaris]
MRSVQRNSHILPLTSNPHAYATSNRYPEVEPLRRIELHQVEHDEIQSLRQRLLQLIVENEERRKVSRFRLVN